MILPTLKPNDTIEIIAPASRCADARISELKNLLESWQLKCIIANNLFGDDLLCANSDEIRFDLLKNALLHPTTKAVICARGGYGCARLIPQLIKISPPESTKLFIGMSDITALNLFLQQEWQWPVVHGALAQDKFSDESIQATKSILFGETTQIEFAGKPLNHAAEKNYKIEASVTGGNLCLIQHGVGTLWEMDSMNKIIFLEEVGERGYRVDRMLEHLRQANLFENAAAIVFGDFTEGKEADGSSLVHPVLERFAKSLQIPVIKIEGVGHSATNFPLPLGTHATLQLGNQTKLICYR